MLSKVSPADESVHEVNLTLLLLALFVLKYDSVVVNNHFFICLSLRLICSMMLVVQHIFGISSLIRKVDELVSTVEN